MTLKNVPLDQLSTEIQKGGKNPQIMNMLYYFSKQTTINNAP